MLEHVVRPWFRSTVTRTARGEKTHAALVRELESPEGAAKRRRRTEDANEQKLGGFRRLSRGVDAAHAWKEDAVKPKREVASEPASRRITERIRELGDWRGERLAQVRALIHEADPDVVEEWKWMGTSVWSHDGVVCTGETYRQLVKLTFAKGASLGDPKGLFNASLDGNTRRAIDLREQDRLDGAAFRALFLEAVAFNREHPPKRRPSRAIAS